VFPFDGTISLHAPFQDHLLCVVVDFLIFGCHLLLGFPPIVLQETQKQKKGQAVKKSKAEKDTLSGPNLPRNLQLILGKG